MTERPASKPAANANATRSSRHGITLMEMSVVLGIVGLIIGGVVAVMVIVKVAELRSQVSQIENIKSAVTAFKLKYNCLPGDCATATQFFPAATEPEKISNGNGNGVITGSLGDSTDVVGRWYAYGKIRGDIGEWYRVFDHLAAAGLVASAQYNENDETEAGTANKPGVAYPKLKVNDAGQGWAHASSSYIQGGLTVGYHAGVSYISAGHQIGLGMCRKNDLIGASTMTAGFVCGLNVDTALQLDTKMDDGKPYSGNVVAIGSWGGYPNYIPGGALRDR